MDSSLPSTRQFMLQLGMGISRAQAEVRISKADLVPTDANLRAEYGSFAQFELACVGFCKTVSVRPLRTLVGDRRRCWLRNEPAPAVLARPHTVACEVTRVGAAEHLDGELRSRPVLGARHPARWSAWGWACVWVGGRGADEQVVIVQAQPGQ